MNDANRARVCRTLASVCTDIDVDAIQNDTTLESFKLDSLAMFELKLLLERQVGREIPDAKLLELKTVQDLLDVIDEMYDSSAVGKEQ